MHTEPVPEGYADLPEDQRMEVARRLADQVMQAPQR